MTLREEFLHHVWLYQKFDNTALLDKEGNIVQVIKTGTLNKNAGPDFENARIIIEGIEWAGSVEVHIKSSDWNKHNHQSDFAYEKVILHVVWENDLNIKRKDGSLVPTIELKNSIDKEFLRKFKSLIDSDKDILCKAQFAEIDDITKYNMLEKALANRLEQKAQLLYVDLENVNNDFEELAYRAFMRNMGFKLNSDIFYRLSQNLPFKILQKHRHDVFQLEALLFGQAGFLKENSSEYGLKLLKEYDFLAQKYDLNQAYISKSEWKFLRTRPGNFPTVRLAQVASILNNTNGLFDLFVLNLDAENISKTLRNAPSAYWQAHYDFDKPYSSFVTGMGKSSADLIILNTAVVLLSLYSQKTDNYLYFENAISLLENIKPEVNNITKKWENLGLSPKNAFDSQALIQQYNHMCLAKKCISCAVGVAITR